MRRMLVVLVPPHVHPTPTASLFVGRIAARVSITSLVVSAILITTVLQLISSVLMVEYLVWGSFGLSSKKESIDRSKPG